MKKNCLLVALLIIAFCPGICFSTEADIVGDVTEVSINAGTSDSVIVSVMTVKTPKNYVYERAFMWGGSEMTSPKRIIETINVVKNKQRFFIPLSTYVDLGNPRHVSLDALPAHRFRLVIVGGDAASSYIATLDFKSDEISHRKVVSGEFPKEVWEETDYSFNHLNN